MSELRVICTGTTKAPHRVTELARFDWTPERDADGVALWSPQEPLRTMTLDAATESARPRRDGKSSRHVVHTPVTSTERADGGTTWHVPECPRCGHPVTDLRDTTLRRYVEATRNTPLAGVLDITHVRSL